MKKPRSKTPTPEAVALAAGKGVNDLKKELMAEKIIRERQKNAVFEKEYLSTAFVENYLMRYLSKCNSNIERAAGVGIDEIGPKIIEAGEVLPCHIEEFTNVICKIIHETKMGIVRELQNYDPGAKKGK